MAGSIKGIIVEIGGDTSGLQKALSKVNSSTFSLSKELKGINSLLKLDPKSTELLSQKQTVLKQNIDQTSKKLEQLKNAQQMADDKIAKGGKVSEENYRNLQREIINTQNKLNQFKVEASNWTKAGRSIEEFGNKVTNISKKLDGMGTTLSTRLTLPILGIATAAVKTGNDFEAQMSRVQGIAGATKQELEKLTDQAIELGAKTSFNSKQVAEGMENLASAGFNTNEIMAAMPGLLDLAASSGAELSVSSEITASALRGFGIEADKAGHVADVFATAAARTNAQTEDMGEAMKYVAPVAKTVGLSIEETAAAIGIMSDAGVKGSQAGTTLRGGLTRIVKPTKMVRDAMSQLGVSFYDNKGRMKSLTEIIQTLQEHTKGLTDKTKNQALAQIFGTEALSGMLALVNRGSDELSSMTKSFESCDGAAAEMAETMLDNTAGTLESLSGSFESAGIVIQKVLAPEIRKLSKWIQEATDDFTGLNKEEQLNIIKNVALVAAIGPAIKILAKFGSGIGTVSKGVGIFSQAIAVATNHTTSNISSVNNLAKGLTFLVSPAGLATVSISALVAGITYLAAKQLEATKKTREFAQEVSNQKQTYEEYNQNIDKATSANISQINSVSRLKDELSTLVDENGKVKEGYESRVSFILSQLNSALGTEYKLNGNVVQSYKDLQKEIDGTIEKKRAEIILNSEQEKWSNARDKEAEAVKIQKSALDKLGTSLENAKTRYQSLKEKKEEFEKTGKIYNSDYFDTSAEVKNLDNLITAYEDSESVVKQCTEDKKAYERDYALFIDKKYNEVGKTISDITKNWTNSSTQEMKNRIIQEQSNLTQYKQMYERTGNEVSQQQMQQAQQNLGSLANELISRTNTVGALGTEEVLAWRTLGENSFEEYKKALAKMPPEMQQKIQETTGIVANDTTLASSAGNQAVKMNDRFNNKLDLKQKTQGEVTNVASTLNNDTSIGNASGNVGEEVDSNFNGKLDGSGWANDLIRNIVGGLSSSGALFQIGSAAGRVAKTIYEYLHHTTPDKGPLKDDDTWMPDLIDNMSKGLINNKSKVVKSARIVASDLEKTLNREMDFAEIKDFGKFQGSINKQIIDSTKTIFTTPQIVFNVQELDEAKLQQCFRYINRKFGTKY